MKGKYRASVNGVVKDFDSIIKARAFLVKGGLEYMSKHKMDYAGWGIHTVYPYDYVGTVFFQRTSEGLMIGWGEGIGYIGYSRCWHLNRNGTLGEKV